MASYSLNIGGKNDQKISKPKRLEIKNQNELKYVTSQSDTYLYRAALKYLKDDSFNLQTASINEDTLSVVYSQSKYRSPVKSAGRAIKILDDLAPKSIKTIEVAELNGGLGLYKTSINRNELNMQKNITAPNLLLNDIDVSPFNFDKDSYKFKPKASYPITFSKIGPDLKTQIGGPDGFFFGDLRLTFYSETVFSKNINLVSRVDYSILDNMDDLKLASDSVLPHVRTDIVEYLRAGRKSATLRRFQLNKFGQYKNSVFYKLSAGIFESMFGGYGGEFLYRPFYSNYGIGVDLWRVKQRDYHQKLKFRDYETTTGHISLYYHEPRSHILFTLKGGRYLAQDSGVTFDFARLFRSGMRVGAYFTLTDISAEEFGEGSFDKGFYFWVPIGNFTQEHTKNNFGWGLRPVTRDGGQFLIQSFPLWGVTDYSGSKQFEWKIDEFYD